MDEIVGHEDARSFFDRALSASSLHHAYLVLGPEHVGKTTFVEAVASRILSTTPPRLDAHPDFVRVRKSVDEKTGKERTEISVEQIRALRETLSTHPVSARYRLAFIEEAAALSDAAANALLKTLEEPNTSVVIFLRAAHISDVPRTIVSRVEPIRLRPLPYTLVAEFLRRLGGSREEADILTEEARGLPGLGRQFLLSPKIHEAKKREREAFLQVLDAPLAKRSVYLSHALPKGQGREKAMELLAVWEEAIRARWHESKFSAPLTEAIARLFQSREALAKNAPPLLALEHTLFFL